MSIPFAMGMAAVRIGDVTPARSLATSSHVGMRFMSIGSAGRLIRYLGIGRSERCSVIRGREEEQHSAVHEECWRGREDRLTARKARDAQAHEVY